MSAPAAPRPPPAPARPAPVVALNLMHESPPPDPGDPMPWVHHHQHQRQHQHEPAAATRPMTGTVPLDLSRRSASTSSAGSSSSSSHSSRIHDGGGSGHGQDSTAAAAPPTPRQPPFVCAWGDCTAAFYVLGDLTRHVDTHYTYTKGALCRWKDCWRRVGFEGGRHMQFHMNSHTGARPFQCPICLKRFSTVPNFRTHSKNVHGSQNAQYTHIEYDPATEPLQVTPHNNTNNTGKKYNTLKSENCGQNRKRVKRPRSSNRTSSTSSADSGRGGTMSLLASASSSASGSPMVTDDDNEDELHDSPDEQTDEDDELFVSDDDGDDDDGPIAAVRARAKRPRLDHHHEPPSPPKTPNGTRSLSRPRRVSRRMSDTVAALASPARSAATSPVGRRRRTSTARIEDAVMLDEEQVETIALDGTIHQQRDEDEARRGTTSAREALMPWSSSSPAMAGAAIAAAGAAAAHSPTRPSTLRFVSAQPRARAPSRASDDSGTASSLPPSDDDYDDDPPFASASSAIAEAEMAARGRPRERARPRPPLRRGSSESIELRRGVAATRAHLHRAGHDDTSPTPAIMPRRRADSGIGMDDGDEPTGLRRSLRTRTAAPSHSSSHNSTSVVAPTRHDTRRVRNEEDYDQIDEEIGNNGPGNAPMSRYPTLRRRHAAAVAAATNTNLATGNYAAVAAAAAHVDLTTPRRSRSPAASKTGPTMSSLYKSLRTFARAARTMRQRDMAGTLDRNAPVPAEIAAFLGSTQFMPSRQLRRELRALEKTCRAKMQDLKRAAAAPVVATADEEDVDLTDDGMSDPGAVSPVLAPVRNFADEDDDPDVEMEAAQTVEAAMDLLTLCSRPVSPTLTRADSADGSPLAAPSAPTIIAATIIVHPPEFSLNASPKTSSPVPSLHAYRPPSPPHLRALANAPPAPTQPTHLATPPTPMAVSPDLGSATPLALPSPKVPMPTGPLALSDHHGMSLPPLRNHHLPPRPMAPALVLPRPYVGDRVPLVALKRVSPTPSTGYAAEFPSPAATPANSLRPRNGLC
ncbi:hypothetical protein AMAG_06272 [Allomyces macrogynus ATCC 38327]|uniref:C2H2-type domain-containing protein n=1 Tax=Allomyces macrogynus (strain ATCC 38327) TaxID=578462 RepID=A0A0L0SG55_ALLM3|nr:hypothetical protein AMAG_06272 [Allomyces macrogynus ATCC 38327]|eukprot:KNE61447.1 hypothetical protein AMAG_06272 [Allomyces macrogynus ATCC 38327]